MNGTCNNMLCGNCYIYCTYYCWLGLVRSTSLSSFIACNDYSRFKPRERTSVDGIKLNDERRMQRTDDRGDVSNNVMHPLPEVNPPFGS